MSTDIQVLPMNPKVQVACIIIGTILLFKGIRGINVVDLRIPPTP